MQFGNLNNTKIQCFTLMQEQMLFYIEAISEKFCNCGNELVGYCQNGAVHL
jgi:hypothetical protein